MGVQCDAFRESVQRSFHSNQLRIHIIRRRLRHRRQRVRRNPRPRAYAYIHALRQRLRPQVRSPIPARHVRLDRRIQRVHSHLAISANHNRLHVAGAHLVQPHQFASHAAELIHRIRKLHPVNSPGIDQPLHVFAQPEYRGALRRFVAANPFKNARPVAHHMGKHMKFRVVPVDELSVVPDFLAFLYRHCQVSLDVVACRLALPE